MSAGNSIKAMPMMIVDTFTLNDATVFSMHSQVLKIALIGLVFLSVICANVANVYSASGGLLQAVSILRFVSDNPRSILLSYDGVTDNDIIVGLAGNYTITPQLGATPANYVATFSKGTKIYLKLTSMPGLGNLYISGYYQQR